MALIYLVEDDESIREIESIALKNSGHEVIGFENATAFFKGIESIIPDLILLDVMLPDMNGNEILARLRKKTDTRKVPVIMVTAKTTELDMIKSLDDGADDYIKKPFSVMELITRVKVLLRRTKEDEDEIMKFDELVIDNLRHEALISGEVVELTFKEYELLRYLALNHSTVLSRESIMQRVWQTDFEGETRTVDMHIKTLRKKLGAVGERIKTVRNVGYMFE
ncbi:MAG: response regulator transcription factor [Agathobacter sp.]|nr:response regulator transcription factor [Agathobacter sp.]MDY3795273.1 response regulator transcription factor [Agathobacter sp.]